MSFVLRTPYACNPVIDGSVLIVTGRECIVVYGSISAPHPISGVGRRISTLLLPWASSRIYACVCRFRRLSFLFAPSLGRTVEICLSGVSFMGLGLGLWGCDAMTDVVLSPPPDSSQGTAQKAYLSGPWLSVWGTPGGDGQYWPSCGPRSPSSKPHSALSVSSWSSSRLCWCSRLQGFH